MNQPLPLPEHPFRGNSLALRPAERVRSMAARASWSFCGVTVPTGPDARLDKPGSETPALHRRTLLRIGLMALACALFLVRAATAGSLAERQVTPALVVPDWATTPVQASSDPLVGVLRLHSGWILRWGRLPRGFFATVGWDDPNDDETSDDPADDDDGWEGLNALHETEVPGPAWLQEVGCHHSDLEAQSEPLWYEPFLFTSFLTLQRLRC